MAEKRRKTDAVAHVSGSSPDAVAAALKGDVPVVFEGMIEGWAARRWTPEFLAREVRLLRGFNRKNDAKIKKKMRICYMS